MQVLGLSVGTFVNGLDLNNSDMYMYYGMVNCVNILVKRIPSNRRNFSIPITKISCSLCDPRFSVPRRPFAVYSMVDRARQRFSYLFGGGKKLQGSFFFLSDTF